jgi:arginine decarboxylase
MDQLRHYIDMADPAMVANAHEDPSGSLAVVLKSLRPELDLFKVTDDTFGSVSASHTRCFRRVFYRQEDYLELHLSILKGIRERYETPFFSALREYSLKPTGVFHALPISRGKSITHSHWIQDMGRCYGRNSFLAETSSTTGGLDSLLQPTGPLKKAQEKFARAFGSRHSFFVTNGTSTANKIVTQALIRPGDLVLLSHDCHKSHPYALVLAGAQPVYLDAYPLNRYSMFGGVPLREIKRQLLRLKRLGKLDRVRMLLLTNCTFDGIVYDPERIMLEVLAIKPDMVFLWDEAWFAFARATPTYRRRTGKIPVGS